MQEKIFASHLEIAIRYDLPIVLHVRRAAHKIFAAVKDLARCKAVVFHSCPLSFEEAQSLLIRKVNAYFSFGNAVINGHKQAIRSFTLLPAERLLTETDAPFQPARGEKFSQWMDLPRIIEKASVLRGEDAKEIEFQIEKNFRAVFY
jgi:TatD DNase family protein